jgi:hypothetical protein
MTDWRRALREADAQDDENDRLSPDEAESMRREMLAAASASVSAPPRWSWMRPMLVAATVAAMIAVGVIAGRRVEFPATPGSTTTVPAEPTAEARGVDTSVENRQLQFLTPGGTRIIWVFNSEFDLKATMR